MSDQKHQAGIQVEASTFRFMMAAKIDEVWLSVKILVYDVTMKFIQDGELATRTLRHI